MAGENLAGVPYLAKKIIENTNFTISGILMGNPMTSYKFDGTAAAVEMSYQRGLIDDDLFQSLKSCNL